MLFCHIKLIDTHNHSHLQKKKREEKKREEEKRGKKTFPNKKISIENKSKCDFFHNSRLYRSVVKKKKRVMESEISLTIYTTKPHVSFSAIS